MKEKFQSILNVFKNFATSNRHDKFMFFYTFVLSMLFGWIVTFLLNMALTILIVFISEKAYQYMPMQEKEIFGLIKLQVPDWKRFKKEIEFDMLTEYHKPTDTTYSYIAAAILLYSIIHILF